MRSPLPSNNSICFKSKASGTIESIGGTGSNVAIMRVSSTVPPVEGTLTCRVMPSGEGSMCVTVPRT